MSEQKTDQAPATGTQGGGSAPQDNKSQATVPVVDQEQETVQAPKGTDPGIASAFASLRKKNRDYKDRIAQLEAELSRGQSHRPNAEEPPAETGADTSFYDNPQAALDKKAKEIEAKLRREMAQDRERERHQAALLEAEQYLLSQEELKSDPDALKEIVERAESDERIQKISAVDPLGAAKLLHMEWKMAKGLTNASQSDSRSFQARASAPAPSGGGGAPTPVDAKSLEELARSLDPRKSSPEEYARLLEAAKKLRKK